MNHARICALGLFAWGLASYAAGNPQTPATPTVPINVLVGSVTAEVTIAKPIAAVWARVGDFCDIRDWVPTDCAMVSGKENEFGAIRTTGREIIVGRTEYSYTYGQFGTDGKSYRLYHGTLEARPITSKTTKLLYSFVWDMSSATDEAAREQQRKQRMSTATRLLENMKILVEGGKVAPYSPTPSPAQRPR